MIERIIIERAGPLRKTEFKLSGANLITGLNESGKTTVVDIIADFMMSGMKKVHDRNNFQKITGAGISRYGGSENWNYEIRGEIDPPAVEDFNALSLLLVRSNRNLIQNKEALGVDSVSYWKQTAGAIMSGSSSSPSIFKKLREYTNPNKQIWSIIERLEVFRELLNRKKAELNDFEKVRSGADRSESRIKEIIERLDILRKARVFSEFKEMESLYGDYCSLADRIESAEKELKTHDIKSMDSLLSEWEKMEKRKSDLSSRYNELMLKIQSLCSEQASTGYAIDEKKKMLNDLSERISALGKNGFDFESTRKRIDSLYGERESIRVESESVPYIPVSAALLAGAGIITLAGLALSVWALLPAVSLVAAGAIRFVFHLRKRKKMQYELNRRAATVEGEINEAKTSLMIEERDASRNFESIEGLKQNRLKLEKEMSGLDDKKAETGRILKDLEVDKMDIEKESEDIEIFLRENLSLYESRISLASKTAALKSRKDSLERERAQLEKIGSRINSLFETDNLSPSNLFAILENEKKLIDFSVSYYEYSEDEYQKLIAEKESLTGDFYGFKNRYSSLKTGIMAEASASLKSIRDAVPKEKTSSRFYDLYLRQYVDDLEINDLTELDLCIEKASEVIKAVSSFRSFGEFISQAVSEIDSKQESIIESVVAGPEFRKYFSKLTGYDSVEFSIDQASDSVIFLIGENSYALNDLSAGALDQFYFAFRISLLKYIFDNPSTLILDDAFIHFDRDRRRAALSLLKELSSEGWQFLYSAVDDGMIEGLFREVFGRELNIITLNA